jgi:hypothetical protein
MNPWYLISWAAAIAISSILIGYAGGVIYAAIKAFILQPRDLLRYREHTRRLLEIQRLDEALKGKPTNASRILWHAIQKAGGEIELGWDDVLDDKREYLITRREKSGRSISFSTRR